MSSVCDVHAFTNSQGEVTTVMATNTHGQLLYRGEVVGECLYEKIIVCMRRVSNFAAFHGRRISTGHDFNRDSQFVLQVSI
jgi:hypothetical protein